MGEEVLIELAAPAVDAFLMPEDGLEGFLRCEVAHGEEDPSAGIEIFEFAVDLFVIVEELEVEAAGATRGGADEFPGLVNEAVGEEAGVAAGGLEVLVDVGAEGVEVGRGLDVEEGGGFEFAEFGSAAAAQDFAGPGGGGNRVGFHGGN